MASTVTPLRLHQDAMLDDAVLVGRALEGAAFAKAELFRRHAPRLLGLLTRMLSSVSDAEDAAQDTFVSAFADLAKLRDRAGFGGWVTGIAVHQAHRRFRKRKLLRALGFDASALDASFEQVADASIGPEERAELAKLQAAVDRLPLQERSAWMLRKVEGYELQDIASILSISLATVKRKLQTADALVAKLTGQEVEQ
jgi:RNA polymerase sigma-70 factor (ECF subfamily)